MKTFKGKVMFLDKADINTDEIIPAKYLTEIDKQALKPHLLEDLKLQGFDPESSAVKEAGIIVTRENFGCGSSREHAPWVLEANGINAVIAPGFARIFRQNMFNCGMMAIELSPGDVDKLFSCAGNRDTEINVDIEKDSLEIKSAARTETFSFKAAEFDKALVKAGGWLEYADNKY